MSAWYLLLVLWQSTTSHRDNDIAATKLFPSPTEDYPDPLKTLTAPAPVPISPLYTAATCLESDASQLQVSCGITNERIIVYATLFMLFLLGLVYTSNLIIQKRIAKSSLIDSPVLIDFESQHPTSSIEQSIRQQQTDISAMSIELKALRTKLTDLMAHHSTTLGDQQQTDISAMSTELKALGTKLDSFKTHHSTTLEELRAANRRLTADLKTQRSATFDELKAANKRLATENQDLKSKLANLEQKCDRSSSRAEEVKTANISLTRDVATLQRAYSSKISQLEDENQQLSQRYTSLERSVAALDAKLDLSGCQNKDQELQPEVSLSAEVIETPADTDTSPEAQLSETESASNVASASESPAPESATLSHDGPALCYFQTHKAGVTSPCVRNDRCVGDPTRYDQMTGKFIYHMRNEVRYGGINEKNEKRFAREAIGRKLCCFCFTAVVLPTKTQT